MYRMFVKGFRSVYWTFSVCRRAPTDRPQARHLFLHRRAPSLCCSLDAGFIVINLSMQFSLTHLPKSHRIQFAHLVYSLLASTVELYTWQWLWETHKLCTSIDFNWIFQLFNFKEVGVKCVNSHQRTWNANICSKLMATLALPESGSTVASSSDLRFVVRKQN